MSVIRIVTTFGVEQRMRQMHVHYDDMLNINIGKD